MLEFITRGDHITPQGTLRYHIRALELSERSTLPEAIDTIGANKRLNS